MVQVPNQLGCYINRKQRHGEQYVNFLTQETYEILGELKTYGAVLVYFYLCSQVPHTYDGKLNSDCKDKKPYGISPKAIKEAYGNIHDLKTYREGIDRLIQLGILKKVNGNIYQFDDIPLKYRIKTYDEYEEMQQMSAEESFKLMHKEQLQEALQNNIIDNEMLSPRKKYSWED